MKLFTKKMKVLSCCFVLSLTMNAQNVLETFNSYWTSAEVNPTLPVTNGILVNINAATPTLYDFSSTAGFENVDEVRFTDTAMSFFFEDWTYNLTPGPTIWNGTTWSNGAPTSTIDAVIASSTTPGAFTCKNLTINSGIDLTLGNGITATVNGNITNNGSTSGSGKISIVSATTATLSGTGTYANLDVNTSVGVIVGTNATDTLNITGLLSFTSGRITTNNKAVLKSSATGTAMIYGAAGNYTTNGNFFIIERFIPSDNRKKYVFVTAPLSSTAAPSIYASWQENGAGTVGYGTQITGPLYSNLPTTGFDDVSYSGLSSAFTYNDANASGSKWVGITSTKSITWGLGKAVLLFVRGDRTVGPGSLVTGNTVLRVTGNIYAGNISFGAFITPGANKFSAFGNPYAAPIDWTLLTKANLKSTFTVYDPNLGVFVTSDGTTVSPNTSQQQPKYIQSGQAFFVQNVAAGSSTLNITEAMKATTAPTAVSNTVFGSESIKPLLNVNVYDASNNIFADGVVAVFDNAYRKGLDLKDADKMENFAGETFAFSREGRSLSIEGRPIVAGNDTLFFSMANFAKKAYKFRIDGSNLAGISNATLIDTYTNTQTPLDLSTTTDYTFSVTSDAASTSNDRFAIILGRPAAISTTTTDNSNLFVKMSPNPVSSQLMVSFTSATAKNTVIKFINIIGQVVKTVNVGNVSTGNIPIDISQLAVGTYFVQLLSGDVIIKTQKIVKE